MGFGVLDTNQLDIRLEFVERAEMALAGSQAITAGSRIPIRILSSNGI
jgi:hypothetical protein